MSATSCGVKRKRRDEKWETWLTELPVSVGYHLQKLVLREKTSKAAVVRRILTEYVERQLVEE